MDLVIHVYTIIWLKEHMEAISENTVQPLEKKNKSQVFKVSEKM
jgi:hypothetical protein